MGVNNRQRRAAKKRARQRPRPLHAEQVWEPWAPRPDLHTARQVVLGLLREVDADRTAAERCAGLLLRPDGPVPPALAREAVRSLLQEWVGDAVQRGWRPVDLVQTTSRRCGEAALPGLVALLADEAGRHRCVPRAWQDDLDAAGPARPLDLASPGGLALALGLACCLAVLPPIAELLPPPGRVGAAATTDSTGDPRTLARVRALLAKAESTEYPEEAEALSAKAQELISRHALEQLLTRDAGDPTQAAVARRIWLDAPYVFAKAMLVDQVASANRCRSIVSESLGFCTVVGAPDDVAAVELLVTSLLVQAAAAVLRHGRQSDLTGTSRTRSFRQSFLTAYGQRVGERLRAATDGAAADTGRSGELVPVLRRHAEQVDAVFGQLFPHLVDKRVHVSNGRGWAAGRAAADQAELVVAPQVRAS